MKKISLQKELNSLRNNDIKNSELFLKEVKQLMAGTANEERNILKEVGLGFNIIKSENQTKKLLEFKKLEEEYKGDVYTIGQIRHLALKYNLKFLNSQLFQGTVAPEVGAVLLRFKKEHNLSEYDLRERFFILAPKQMFKLTSRPVNPLLFYKISNKYDLEGEFKLVYKWGEDFTIVRKLSGIINKTESRVIIQNILFALMFFTCIHYTLKFIGFLFNTPLWINSNSILSVSLMTLTVFNWIIAIGFTISKMNEGDRTNSENSWKSEFKD